MENTIICRCSDITLADIKEYVDKGVTEVEEIKRFSRLGMGPCQGRTCMQLIGRIMSNLTGKPLVEVGTHTVRPPVSGVTLGQIARGVKDVK